MKTFKELLEKKKADFGLVQDVLGSVADNMEDMGQEDDAKILHNASKDMKAFKKALKNKKEKGIILDALDQGVDMLNLSSDEEDELMSFTEASDKIEISLTNEGHDFYTDFVQVTEKGPKSILNIEKKMAKVVKMLQKELPGGTWDYTIGN